MGDNTCTTSSLLYLFFERKSWLKIMDPRLALRQILNKRTRFSKSPFQQNFLGLLVLPLEKDFLNCSAPNLQVDFSTGDVKTR